MEENKNHIGFVYGEVSIGSKERSVYCKFHVFDAITKNMVAVNTILKGDINHSECMIDDIYGNVRYEYQSDVTPEPMLSSGHKKIVPLSNKKAMGINGSLITDWTISGKHLNSVTFDIKHDTDDLYDVSMHIRTSTTSEYSEITELGTTPENVKTVKTKVTDGESLRFVILFTRVVVEELNDIIFVPVPVIITDVIKGDFDFNERILDEATGICEGSIKPDWCTVTGVGIELLVTKIKPVRVQYNTIKI